MAGTASPGAPGPSVAPPPLPSGWIAQWDESTRKYYYVELGTGRSQWDVPTQPAPTAISTPANSSVNHPYGIPPSGASPAQQPRIITHADGSQTMQHADGRMEPILPPGTAGAPEGTRGMDGPSGDRGFGTFAQNALNSFAGKQGGGGGGGVGNFGGKVVSGLASSLFSSGGDKPQPQNYHGAPQAGSHSSGGLAGAVMGGVATMFGGSQGKPSGNFGYSNAGPASYSGTAPPISYQPPSQPGTSPTARSAPAPHSQPSPSYHQPQQSSSYQQPQQSPSFQQPQQSPSFQQPQHSPAYQLPPHQQPPHQQPPAPYGGYSQRSAYGGQPQYEHHQPQPPYGGQHQYPHQPAYPGHPPPPSQPGYPSHQRY